MDLDRMSPCYSNGFPPMVNGRSSVNPRRFTDLVKVIDRIALARSQASALAGVANSLHRSISWSGPGESQR